MGGLLGVFWVWVGGRQAFSGDSAEKFLVRGDGAVTVEGTLAVSGAATISGLLTSSVGLTVTAGGLQVGG